MNNNNIVFIFGAPETEIATTQDIPRNVKLASYIHVDKILDKCRPLYVRYLLDEEWILRCWGCHKLIVEFAYPHNFAGEDSTSPIIILCCSHSCSAFIKYFKSISTCKSCNKEFIPRCPKIPVVNNEFICPSCWFKNWSQKLEYDVINALNNKYNILITQNIIKFAILNKCYLLNR